MSQGIRTPGTIYLYAKFHGINEAKYLGTAIQAPEPEGEKFKLEVFNDLSGRSVPFQLVQDGEKWYVIFSMNRFNGVVMENIRALESGRALDFSGVVPAGLGNESGLARGTLVIGQSDFQLITINAYYNTTSAGNYVPNIAARDLRRGRYYYSCNLRKYKESTVGTRVLDVTCAIECQNVVTGNGGQGFSLYTEDPTLFPQLEAIS